MPRSNPARSAHAADGGSHASIAAAVLAASLACLAMPSVCAELALSPKLGAKHRAVPARTPNAPKVALRLDAQLDAAPRGHFIAAAATVAAPASASTAKAADAEPAPRQPAYRDQLIGGVEAPEEVVQAPSPRDLEPGLRSWVVDLRHDERRSENAPRTHGTGVAVLHRRETEHYGDFVVDVQVGNLEGAPGAVGVSGTVGRATLVHERFAATDSLILTTELGVTRTNIAPWLGSSLRISLPTSLVAGAAVVGETPGVRWNASYGEIGRINGLNVQGFDRTSGRMGSLGFSAAAAPGWVVGANAVVLEGSREVPDNAAVTFGAEYGAPGVGPFRVQGLVDDDGNLAGWLDGQWRQGRFVHRAGAYQIEPGTHYGEGTINDDTRGAYYRGEFRRGFDFASFGAELLQNNLRRDPQRGGETTASAYGNLSLRLSSTLTAGGGFFVRDGRARVEGRPNRGFASVNAFVSRQNDWGYGRLDASYGVTDAEEGVPDETSRQVTWSQTWPKLGPVQLSSLVSWQQEDLVSGDERRWIASAGASGEIANNLRWDLSLTAADVRRPQGTERNYNAAASLDWLLTPHWSVQLQWYRTQIETASRLAAEALPFQRENQVLLVARYNEVAGVPYPRIAGFGGRSGAGRVMGSVFLDENGDGVRQPNERGVPGVSVVLDGRQTQVTDRDGRFAFPLVPAGPHSVTLILDRVPLPWGLADESPRPVEVPVRGDGRLDVGLTRGGG